jgi:hypothetical protein
MESETLEQHAAALRQRCRELEADLARARALARPRAVERYYSVSEAGMLLGFSGRWIRDRIRSGELAGVVECGAELRIPASGINAYLDRHQYLEAGIPARTAGELKRKRSRHD